VIGESKSYLRKEKNDERGSRYFKIH